MKLCLFSVYDIKAEAFLPPWFQPNIYMAKRVFGDCVNDDDHAFGKHPNDYSLFQVGVFDDETGQIEPSKAGLGNGTEYLNPEMNGHEIHDD